MSEEKTHMTSSLKTPKGEQLIVKSGRPMNTMSTTFVDNVNSNGPQMLKAGKPRASTPGPDSNKYSS